VVRQARGFPALGVRVQANAHCKHRRGQIIRTCQTKIELLSISIISFPLMLDCDVGLIPAIGASLKLTRAAPVALSGLIAAAGLILGEPNLFVGLAVVMPRLGHSTWRLYRRTVTRDAV
jgi:uncharacterized membrane protein